METKERRLAAYREGWAEGRKHGHAEMRRLIRRRIRRIALSEDESRADYLRVMADLVTVPSREKP